MSQRVEGPPTRWSDRPRLRRLGIGLLFAALLAAGLVALGRQSDFDWHVNLGRAFLAGDPYADGGDWYSPGRAMMDAGLAMLGTRAAKLSVFSFAAVGLWTLLVWWRRMANGQRPAPRPLNFAAFAIALGITLPYVLRDFDESGLQALLLFFLTAGGYALWRGKSTLSGFWLAVAATYKTTPVLFLPFLLWKRQWRAAAAMAAFMVALNLAPALHLGLDATLEAHRRFFARAAMSARVKDPSLNAVEPPKPHNLGLQASLARYLQTHPPGHPLRLDHPWFVQFGDLPPETAGRVVKGILLVLALGLAWKFRPPWERRQTLDQPRRASVRFLPKPWASAQRLISRRPSLPDRSPESTIAVQLPAEWAVVCLLCALMAPLCWKQHLVLGLPCVYLAARGQLLARFKPRWRTCGLALAAAATLLTKRGVVGQELAVLALSYKVDTMAMLFCAFVALVPARSEPVVQEESEENVRRQAA